MTFSGNVGNGKTTSDSIRVVKQSSDLRTSNFKFEFFSPSIFESKHVCLPLPSPPLPAYRRGVQLLSVLHCAPGACCILLQAIKVTNLGGPDTEQVYINGGNRAGHGLMSWLTELLIDCFPACGVRAVTFISPHSADIKHKLLKLLHKYINEVRI